LIIETRRQREDSKMPILAFRFREGPRDPTDSTIVISYRIVNVGSGPAIIDDFVIRKFLIRPGGTRVDGDRIDKVIGSGLEYEVCFAWEPLEALKDRPPLLEDPETMLEIKYRDIFGRRYLTTYHRCKFEFTRL
jgi:hypothetical protein